MLVLLASYIFLTVNHLYIFYHNQLGNTQVFGALRSLQGNVQRGSHQCRGFKKIFWIYTYLKIRNQRSPPRKVFWSSKIWTTTFLAMKLALESFVLSQMILQSRRGHNISFINKLPTCIFEPLYEFFRSLISCVCLDGGVFLRMLE